MLNVKLASVLCVNYALSCRTSQHFAYTQYIYKQTQQRNCSLAPVLYLGQEASRIYLQRIKDSFK